MKVVAYVDIPSMKNEECKRLELGNLPCVPAVGDILHFNILTPKKYRGRESDCPNLILSINKLTKRGYESSPSYEISFKVAERCFNFEDNEVALYLDN